MKGWRKLSKEASGEGEEKYGLREEEETGGGDPEEKKGGRGLNRKVKMRGLLGEMGELELEEKGKLVGGDEEGDDERGRRGSKGRG